MSVVASRRLIHVPIVHTQADLGSMSKSVKDLYVRSVGRAEWDRRVRTVDEMWRRIRADLEALNLPYGRVRLYQDSLATCGREEEIVRELARAGSENHRILVELMEKGARVMGTESPELLVQEYEQARNLLSSLGTARTGRAIEQQQQRSRVILENRDRYIAGRIDETLGAGQIGLLFLGMLHSLDAYLPEDIQVTWLGHDPPGDP